MTTTINLDRLQLKLDQMKQAEFRGDQRDFLDFVGDFLALVSDSSPDFMKMTAERLMEYAEDFYDDRMDDYENLYLPE